mmetsp:Transcript_8116/g.9711  ORF Transcript_8116/g.9711 Transcript_8116/m.9711 type:complete len:185 (-) Transcript_8116:69-623(-)|eukprot:CAMPEP_0170463078 /NCGR_PEP_ID=MMETSP0123-20130129/8326_1 /TAXON_ID=182087 /ORGANISM="Favella ehrenbergii, Strain Fehren 1" /LENGTH=184 /DNA_ID=CAMNT_0010728423 /DNA_START=267 /DNA_END=821 /DNA_ORIENTATION=-
MTGFDAKQFAGMWHMQASTLYANDEFGCIKLSISEPNSKSKIYAALRSVQLFSFNPLQNGAFVADDYTLTADSSGKLSYKSLFFINNDWYSVLDTDYTTYAIVYECSSNNPKFLNYRNDDIHIFTRSETATDADMVAYKATAEAKKVGSAARFETLEQKSCLPKSYVSKVNEMFTDPKKFFRKY